ncbi:BREX-1 system adenine-specific DNA-methyltransferase PglX [Halalkalibacter kiskunsagensis]|uniref:site-specific DNA-methyltransferase (adenine-specific) n=1 Tax=Halalkalibacter kiskunsagensis TaxID=1548599 RepID=A0ABV6KGE7_9BACI
MYINRAELKAFAMQSRRELLYEVSMRMELFGFTQKEEGIIEEQPGTLKVNGLEYPFQMKKSFHALQRELQLKSYEQVIEEVAYTWFNRLIAIRYMEVNGLLSNHFQFAVSSHQGYEPVHNNESDPRKHLINQCNHLHYILPKVFTKIEGYTELLMPDFLLDRKSGINCMLQSEALLESFREVEVIGWLYQFYNIEPKEQVFTNLKKNKKINKFDIPAATQLFTPKWIVKYMVENSLGQIWLDGNPSSSIKKSMDYYIVRAEQEEQVDKKLNEMRYKQFSLEEIKFIDPCVGSGHILVYAFDLFFDMYVEAGYEKELIPKLIFENNLFGVDIDDRAAQLATFALLMKAREKTGVDYEEYININIFAVQESNELDIDAIGKLISKDKQEAIELKQTLLLFKDAKQFGSILRPSSIDFQKYLERLKRPFEVTLENYHVLPQLDLVGILLNQAKVLADTYDITVTNPPYLGLRGLHQSISDYIKREYPYSKYDLFAVFMERAWYFTKEKGYYSMLNQQSWMFLSSYEKLRAQLFQNSTIISMLHLGAHTFEDISGEVVQSTAFVNRRVAIYDYNSTFHRLVDYKNTSIKEKAFIDKEHKYICKQEIFSLISESPIVYWLTDRLHSIFLQGTPLKQIAEPRQGLATANNDRFHRLWYEVGFQTIGFGLDRETAEASACKWFPLNKSGTFKKWYGSNEYVVNWQYGGKEIKEDKLHKLSLGKCLPSNSKPKNVSYYFRKGITWSLISSKKFGVRCYSQGMIFDVGSHAFFCEDEDYYFFASFLNSKVASTLLHILNPTINYSSGIIAKLPILVKEKNEQIDLLTKENIELARSDWDSAESSWDFSKHPFMLYKHKYLISNAFEDWKEKKEELIRKTKENEEKLNQIYIKMYSLEGELSPYVNNEDVTIQKADRKRDTKSFLSYFVGCLLGRYSLDVEGLAYAGGEWEQNLYHSFIPNDHGIQILTDKCYFEDDLIMQLRKFLSVAFGEDTVEENMLWLAQSIGLTRKETPDKRLRRYFFDEFFQDHVRIYKNRPIYWVIESGKHKGLRTLIYLHRMQGETIEKVRLDHLKRMKKIYKNEIENPKMTNSTAQNIGANKKILQEKLMELMAFDQLLVDCQKHVENVNLDDGVRINYRKLSTVLAKL